MRRLLGTMSTRIEYDIRRFYFAHLLRMPLSFFQRHRTGDLMARATNDLQAVSVFFTYGLRSLIELVLVLTFSLAMMTAIHWRLTLIVLVPLPVLCLITVRMSSLVHNRFRSIQDCFGDISNFVQESPRRDPRGQVVRAGRAPDRGVRPPQQRVPGAQPPLHPRARPVPAAVADHRLVRAGAQPAVRRQGGHRRDAFHRGTSSPSTPT